MNRVVESGLNLRCYDPRENKNKAEFGACRDGFQFLGCDVRPGNVRPTKESRTKLKQKIDAKFSEALNSAYRVNKDKGGYLEALYQVSQIVRGWGNSYFFCTDARLFASVDLEIDKWVKQFDERYKKVFFQKDSCPSLRGILGVYRLSDCKRDAGFHSVVLAKVMHDFAHPLKKLSGKVPLWSPGPVHSLHVS